MFTLSGHADLFFLLLFVFILLCPSAVLAITVPNALPLFPSLINCFCIMPRGSRVTSEEIGCSLDYIAILC